MFPLTGTSNGCEIEFPRLSYSIISLLFTDKSKR